jgi:ribosomal protein S18 acetylase RimI-like enzyme
MTRFRVFSAGDPRDGSIWALFVDPAFEGRGIGRDLLALACGTVRAAGFGTTRLNTEPGTRADGFYRANGWIETGRSAKGEIIFQRGFEENHSPTANRPSRPYRLVLNRGSDDR